MTPPARLCSCGKPAGHASVCHDVGTSPGLNPDDVERVDQSWEETEARRREDRFERDKRGLDAERREQRAGMGALELHHLAIERQARLSAVAAGNPEPGRGHADSREPPRPQLLDDDPRWRGHWEVIRSRLERAHELLDETEGHGSVRATTTMLAHEKDQRILNETGLAPADVVAKLGADIAGSPETVRRVRRAAGLSAKDGTPVERAKPSAEARRVVIDERAN